MRVVVIGAGLLGVCTAWYLRQHGCAVTVLERAASPGLETSFANAGILTASQAEPWNQPGIAWKILRWMGREDAPFLLRPAALPQMTRWGWRFLRNASEAASTRNSLSNLQLAHFSLRTLRALRAATRIEYDACTNGCITLFRDDAEMQDAIRAGNRLADHGLPCEFLSPETLASVEPALAPISATLAGAIRYPADESGDAHRFCTALATLAAAQGVEFYFDCDVQKLSRAGGRITAAQTAAGDVEGEHFVIAAGSESNCLLRPVGVAVPMQPVKGYSLTLDLDGASPPPRHPVIDAGLHAALTPLGTLLRVGGTAEFAGFDRRLRAGRVANLYAIARRTYPELLRSDREDAQLRAWAGLRPMVADGVPLLGSTRIPNLFLNTGHGHLGWTMAAGSGAAVAAAITRESVPIDLTPYSPLRF